MKSFFATAARLALFSSLATSGACASMRARPLAAGAAQAAPRNGRQASAQSPWASDGESARPADGSSGGADGDEGPTASAWLERALAALQNEQPAEASGALRAALATGELNDAGRTLAYWYVYVAEQAQDHASAARDALADFVVVAQDVLAARGDVRYAEQQGSDFVDRFDLVGRLARSRAVLSLAWAENAPGFGRSAEQAVPVHDDQEMAYFLELAPPCAHRLEKEAVQEPVAGSRPDVTRVNLRCAGIDAPAAYFFVAAGTGPTAAERVAPRTAPRRLPRRARRAQLRDH